MEPNPKVNPTEIRSVRNENMKAAPHLNPSSSPNGEAKLKQKDNATSNQAKAIRQDLQAPNFIQPEIDTSSKVAARTGNVPRVSKPESNDSLSKNRQNNKKRKDEAKPIKGFWVSKKEKDKTEVEEYFGEKSHLEILKEMIRNLLPSEKIPGTISQCLAVLKPIHINIFDYVAGNYLLFDNIDDLIARCEELRGSSNGNELGAGIGYYPLKQAKEEGFRDLLRSLFHGRRRRR